MTLRPAALLFSVLAALLSLVPRLDPPSAAAEGPDPAPAKEAPPQEAGYRLVEAAAASVNGEVLFLTDVVNERCFYRCGAAPGEGPRPVTLDEARSRYIADVLVLQEQRKLNLGAVDNAALAAEAAAAIGRMEACTDPCARIFRSEDVRDFTARRLLAEEFLKKRVEVFVEVRDDEIAAERERRAEREGIDPGSVSADAVRRDLSREKTEREMRNWFERAASKSRIVLSPLESER